MSDVVERAELALAIDPERCGWRPFVVELVAELKAARAERDRYRQEYEEIEENHALCGLSVHIPHHGVWGSETLMHLFDELGVKPEDDLLDVIRLIAHLRGRGEPTS